MKKAKAVKVDPKREAGKRAGTKVTKALINLLVTLVFGLVYFYLQLPAINLKNEGFYIFVFLLAAVYCATSIITSGIWKAMGRDNFFKSVKNNFKVPLILCTALLLLLVGGMFLSSVVVRSRAYSRLLTVEPGDFTKDVSEVSFDQIPMLDSASAQKLGDRKLGELSDMVSQFEVADNYTQINYQGRPVRVTPLRYGDIIKWLNNRRAGLPAYILIDMVTQNVEVVRLEQGMKYTTDEYFMRNLNRYLRFKYPTFMFDEPVFEIDESGQPYWICPRIVKTIGLFGGKDIRGVVLVNAVTGETEYCEEVPVWVDRAFTADLLISQYDYYGKYASGYLNSLFGQKGVTVTTQGYNYIALNDDVYMYTGVTSVGGDASNVGFILCNQRTKETHYYEIAGATEYSAMDSAEGIVQHLKYESTFPLLLNISGEPTYFMSLKDSAGLVKMYAMVNVQQYNIVASGTTVAECEKSYISLLQQHNLSVPETLPVTQAEGVIAEIRTAVIDGNSAYYIRLEGETVFYTVAAGDFEMVVTANVGDTVKIGFEQSAGDSLLKVTEFEITERVAPQTPEIPQVVPPETPPDTEPAAED